VNGPDPRRRPGGMLHFPAMIRAIPIALAILLAATGAYAQSAEPDWSALEKETLDHYQTLLRFDTSDPPGIEKPAADYLREVLEREGIPVEVFALEPNRPNVVARLKGNGSKKPILIMAHTDVVNVDPKKWTFPPFSATRDGGYVYARGAVDDKDNVASALMVLLTLKRLNVPLDRDVIFLAESGEEGSTRVGIQFMVNEHYPAIEAEYCFAEGGNVTRVGGEVAFASVQTLEKIPYGVELTARGVAGHGSIPLRTNSIVHLAKAVAAVADWRPPVRLNETTSTYFERLAQISPPEEAKWYRMVGDPSAVDQADEYFLENEPRHASMLRTSVSPNIFQGGYRINVIPSEAKATLDVRALPDEDMPSFLQKIKDVVNDPAVEVKFTDRDTRPGAGEARLSSEAFQVIERAIRKHYDTVTLPTMSTGATDMAYLRGKGMQCYGIGPATDTEDGPKGYGSHSDQERLLESELHRFVRFNWDVVVDLARAK
jgi:acetylornithine deacetylase/succinyl-diaminopimelate desuccinylase-like protein